MNVASAKRAFMPPVTVMNALDADFGDLEPLPAMTGGAWVVRTRLGPDLVVAPADAVQAAAARAAAERDVGPRVVDHVDGWLVCEWLEGQHLTALEVRRPAVLGDLGELLARWHATPVTLPVEPMIESRRQYAAAAGSRVTPALARTIEWADEIETALHPAQWAPAHLDVMANVLATDRGLRLIDFEYARSAPPARELGQLMWEGELDRRSAELLVAGYQPRAEAANDHQVAEAATWCVLSGVTWTVWALARPGDDMQRYARRSWERLASHWTHPSGL